MKQTFRTYAKYRGCRLVCIGDTGELKRIVHHGFGVICESRYILCESDFKAEVDYFFNNIDKSMLNVNYKKPYGFYTLTQGENKFKITICKANAMWAEMHFYKNEEGTKMAQLYAFLADYKHAKNCFNNGGTHLEQCDNYVFYAKELKDKSDGYVNDIWKTIRLLAENGKKVTIK